MELCLVFFFVPGLFRRTPNRNEAIPVIGVLPVGRQNTFGENLFNFKSTSKLQRVRGLADASLSIVRGNIVPKDVMKIEVIDEETKAKPVYALSAFEWSAFSDAFNQRDRYWYVGSWRDYATFIFNAFSDSISWNCAATITYTDPCAGCSNCYITPHRVEFKSARRWWSGFIPSFRLGSSQSAQATPDYSKIQNPNCAQRTSIECDSAGIIVSTSNNEQIKTDEISQPNLKLQLIKEQNGFGFISDSWSRLNNNHINLDRDSRVRMVEIAPKPNPNPDQDRFFYIDHESYEVKTIRITLLPKFANFYAT